MSEGKAATLNGLNLFAWLLGRILTVLPIYFSFCSPHPLLSAPRRRTYLSTSKVSLESDWNGVYLFRKTQHRLPISILPARYGQGPAKACLIVHEQGHCDMAMRIFLWGLFIKGKVEFKVSSPLSYYHWKIQTNIDSIGGMWIAIVPRDLTKVIYLTKWTWGASLILYIGRAWWLVRVCKVEIQQ